MTQLKSRLSQIKVLIAEQTPDAAHAIARNLENAGYAIAGIVNSCEQALESATIAVPDLVLLEMSLPGHMDSFTVGRKIWEDLNCPVVYMTASPHPGAIAQASLASPYECLVKPFTAETLKLTLQQTLQHYRTQQQAAYEDDIAPLQAELTQEDGLLEAGLKQPFLALLSAASAIKPMPRVLFEDQVLKIYTGTLESAFYLRTFCQQQTYSYQIFIWQWQSATFQLFDESDQNCADSPDLR